MRYLPPLPAPLLHMGGAGHSAAGRSARRYALDGLPCLKILHKYFAQGRIIPLLLSRWRVIMKVRKGGVKWRL